MDFFTNLLFSIKRPKLIVVTGNNRACAAEAIFRVLSSHFSVIKIRGSRVLPKLFKNIVAGGKILIWETELEKPAAIKRFSSLLKKSRLAVLVATHVGEIPADEFFFAGEKEQTKGVLNLAKKLAPQDHLVLNFDDETVREIQEDSRAPVLTFGFQEGANLLVSDLAVFNNTVGAGTNFKVNYQGNIVPVWLTNTFGKEQIYSALAGVCCGVNLGMNLVEISQALKFYQSLSGRMKLIAGIKNSQIVDDSENASPHSMVEALKLLADIKAERRVAVLGDILGVGKYAMEAHEAIGQRVAGVCELLFTVGARAKFIADGAQKAGMRPEQIFQFDEVEAAAMALQQKIEQGDLILVDGAHEMEMRKVVTEVRETVKFET